MYAIIAEDGGQYRVEEGQEIVVNFREESAGSTITFDRVLVCSGNGNIRVGTPIVDGATVQAEVLGPEQGEKLTVQKFRRRKNYRRRTGHRQLYTRIKISKISG